ncbi:MAG: STAS domain-containing protein [Anaerolineae bacterium]|nr:STAS domain-containing protein [Anaerolineae bacterium]
MENFESKLHSPGVMIYRAKGNLSTENVEEWRDELSKFVKENDKRGACGVLIDVCDLENLSPEALDILMELLGDPEETIRDVRMRFALIGVKPFTQRFLRETMPIEELKHIRARFFHEVAEDEALAWLQAMVSTAEEESKKAEPDKKEAKEATVPKEKEAPKTQKEPEKKDTPKSVEEPKKKAPEKKPAAAKLLPTLLKGTDKAEEKKEKLKQRIKAGR